MRKKLVNIEITKNNQSKNVFLFLNNHITKEKIEKYINKISNNSIEEIINKVKKHYKAKEPNIEIWKIKLNDSNSLLCPKCGSELTILPNGEECFSCGYIDIDI